MLVFLDFCSLLGIYVELLMKFVVAAIASAQLGTAGFHITPDPSAGRSICSGQDGCTALPQAYPKQ